MEVPSGALDAQACVTWVFADPTYVVRFRADEKTLEQLVWDLKLRPDDFPHALLWPQGFGSVPKWWHPDELLTCGAEGAGGVESQPFSIIPPYKTWRSSSGGPFVYLYACPISGIVYLFVVYT